MDRRQIRALVLAGAIGSASCATGQVYSKPEVVPPAAYKEIDGWKQAEPDDQAIRGKWWELFDDAQLNALEERVTVSNETLKGAQAQFEQARALVRASRASYSPQVTVVPTMSATDQSENRPLRNPNASTRVNDFVLPVDVSYEADVWGRIRHTVEASQAGMQASAADLESVSLSLHAELALDYFSLRALDAEQQLLDQTVQGYERALELTQNRFNGGIAGALDVAQAQTQLETTRAQAIDDRVRRAALEHAIAVLVGQPASSFTLAASPLTLPPTPVPAGLPSDLLERRPDISAAERRVAAANAQMGVRSSAFYPLLTMNGAGGFESASIGSWIRAASTFWTAAPALALTVFDGGRRKALSDQARASYDQTVAGYQGAVLNAFREVEDNLSALHHLQDEAQAQRAAAEAAERSLTLSTNRYRGGVSTYLEVISAQTIALSNQRAALNVQMRQLTASVLLIKALGGGWTTASLP